MCSCNSQPDITVTAAVSIALRPQPETLSTHLLRTWVSFPVALKEDIVSTCPESVTQQADQCMITSELRFTTGHDPQEQQGYNPHSTTCVSKFFRKASCCTEYLAHIYQLLSVFTHLLILQVKNGREQNIKLFQ